MFIYLLYILFYVTLSRSEELLVKDSGIGFIDEDDIAMVFYITLENKSARDFEVLVHMVQCCDTTDENRVDHLSMSLIGGDMGILHSKSTKNVTLLYPNMYLKNRQGHCMVNIQYRNEGVARQRLVRITFNTIVPNEDGCECQTVDMDSTHNCRPVDCVTKYSGMRNYFDAKRMECVPVTTCISSDPRVPEIGYSIATNNCTNLNDTIGKDELHLLDNNKSAVYECNCSLIDVICHHGCMEEDRQCECDTGWTTTTDEEMYSPTLLRYHMCNIEVGAWNSVNKRRIKTTTILIAVFSITIASKILILICILNWCYKRYKYQKDPICSEKLDPDREEIILCPNLQQYDECMCEEKPKRDSHILQTTTVNVSYYPCMPSAFSSYRGSLASEKCKCSLNSEESIVLSKTTSSPHGSLESESEVVTEAEEEANDEDAQFSGEGEECSDLEGVVQGEEMYGEGEKSDVVSGEELCEESGEQSDYTAYSTFASRKESTSSKSKSKSITRKSKGSIKHDQ